jgi:hypothetical protein
MKTMFLKKCASVCLVLLALGLILGLGTGGFLYYVHAEAVAEKAPANNLPAEKVAANQAGAPQPAQAQFSQGKLYGLVYLADKPLTTGKVVVTSEVGGTFESMLDAKGAYTINGGNPIPIGTYKVGIVSDDPQLRKKYKDGKTSGLTAEATAENTPASWNLKSNLDKGKMFGLVRVDGKILIGGKVIFHDTDGTTYEGPLDSKGDYIINKGMPIPSDTYLVTIISNDPLLPKRYADVKTTDLTVTVTSQNIPHSWNLGSQ